MVKERSYKILEQLDEFELQEAGESSITVYDNDTEGLTRDTRANVVPSAIDASEDNGNHSDDEQSTGANGVHREVPTQEAGSGSSVQQQNGGSASSSSSIDVSGANSSVINSNDGVFSNMAAKPDLYLGYDDKIPDEPLPTYQDIYGPQSTAAPPYFEPAIVSVGDEEELLIEGLPTGSIGVFLVNLIISAAFQIVGYMLTFVLHSSHAAKDGSLAGLGITFFNFGYYMYSVSGDMASGGDGQGKVPGHPPSGGDSPDDTSLPMDNMYFAYLLMVIGCAVLFKALFDYFRVRRLQSIIESSPEQNV